MKSDANKRKNNDSAEQISAREALDRMKRFVERKDKFVDAIKAGKDRGVSAGKKR